MNEALKGGADWASVVAENGLTSDKIPSQTEQVSGPDQYEVSQIVYESSKPAAESVVNGGGALSSGKYAVFQVTDVVPGEASSASEQGTRKHQESYQAAIRCRTVRKFRSAVKRRR